MHNPLLHESALPYELPDFAAIRLEHVEPAFAEAVHRHAEDITAICTEPTPTWENTVEAFERAGRDLERVTAWFFNLQATDGDVDFDRVADAIVPKLSAHTDSIYQNEELYHRLLSVTPPDDPEAQRLHDLLIRRFNRRGATLGADEKTRLQEINQRLSELSELFGRNLLADTKRLAQRFTRDELAGLTEEQLAGFLDSADGARDATDSDARDATDSDATSAAYLVPLELPATQPLLADLADRASRRRLLDASLARGTGSNREILLETVRLRQERARLLGFDTHADYVIAEETAGSADAARQLIADLAPAAAANANAERKLASELAGHDVDAADWPYYEERRRERDLDIDTAELRKYFPLERVLIDGAFHAAELLYGIHVHRRPDLHAYRDDVDVWEVTDHDGSGLGLLLTDYWARPSKRGGAWMSTFVEQSRLLGTRPVVVNVMSITSELLTIDEVTTVFHEFGHALHALLSDVRYPSLSGTNVPRDWVEFPSQINENFAFHPDMVRGYARHVDTGEVIPDHLLEAVRASRQFGQGFATAEYLAAAAIDLGWHSLTGEVPTDIEAFEEQILHDVSLTVDHLQPRYRSTFFNHIFAGGYSAGYYSYLWAEALDADGYSLVEEEGLTREVGQRFRDTILSKGASRDYAEAYRAFRGRGKDTRPLLVRRGLAGTNVTGARTSGARTSDARGSHLRGSGAGDSDTGGVEI